MPVQNPQDGFFTSATLGGPATQWVRVGPGVIIDKSLDAFWAIRTSQQHREDVTGAKDDVNTVFEIRSIPDASHPVLIFQNRLVLEQGIDYAIDRNKITFVVPPRSTDIISVLYWR